MAPSKIDLTTQAKADGTYTGYVGVVEITPTFISTSGSSSIYQACIEIQPIINPPADTAALFIGIRCFLLLQGTHNHNPTGGEFSAAGEFFSLQYGTGVVSDLAGLAFGGGNTNGAVTRFFGAWGQSGTQGAGTIVNDYTLYIKTPTTTALISNHYGLYIEDQTAGGANNPNPWAIWVAGGNTNLGPGKLSVAKVKVTGLQVYANNAAAITGGLSAGDFYRTGANPDVVCVVH